MNAWMPVEPPFDRDSFSGVGRLFPLPQVVSFPHVVTPLHVFESRYRALTSQALDGDGLITMAVLKPGWEADYAGRPPLCPVGCLGKVISHHADEEGRYNLLILGLRRVRLLEEVTPPLAFRQSTLELIEEFGEGDDDQDLRGQLIKLLLGRLMPGGAEDELDHALSNDATLGAVTDLAAHSLPLDAEIKLTLLGEPDAKQRARLILKVAPALGKLPGDDAMPPFSMN